MNRDSKSAYSQYPYVQPILCYILSLLAQDTFFMTNPFSLSSRFGPSILGHCTIVSSDSSSFRACTAFYLSSDPNPMFSDFSSFRFRPWTLIYSSSGSILPKRTSIGPFMYSHFRSEPLLVHYVQPLGLFTRLLPSSIPDSSS